jgi:argininosuccinate lyase
LHHPSGRPQHDNCAVGFEEMIYNSVYSGINRGKVESAVASALSSLGNTLAKFSMDICLFMTTEFRFIEFPDDLITGSSIMPQKKNRMSLSL